MKPSLPQTQAINFWIFYTTYMSQKNEKKPLNALQRTTIHKHAAEAEHLKRKSCDLVDACPKGAMLQHATQNTQPPARPKSLHRL